MRLSILARGVRVCTPKNIKIFSLYSHEIHCIVAWPNERNETKQVTLHSSFNP